jgi:2'-hydroxyisoflavone reductase
MRILVLGGVFLGAAIVDSALARGHAITVFNRGHARTAWPAGVDAIVGDRGSDLARVGGRRFDAVIDVCGFVPGNLRASAAALASCAASASDE